MRRVLIVDWLGRGGIAQTTEAWAREAIAGGGEVRVVTRGGRELAGGEIETVSPAGGGPRLLAHARLCAFAAGQIRSWRPDVVVIQNYVLPVVEELVHRAARRSGAETIVVVHNHRHHDGAGSNLGLDPQLHAADRVVVHSEAVADGLAVTDPIRIPHPVQTGMLAHPGDTPFHSVEDANLALHFGVLHRGYKGTDLVAQMAGTRPPGAWRFAFAGVGAPTVPGAQSADRFLGPGELVAAVTEADAVLLPYERATQSGAVVLAQLCGTVPIASGVGGLSEQIDHGVTGLLLAPGAGPEEWLAALDSLGDPARRISIAEAGERSVWERHDVFRQGVREVLGLMDSAVTRTAAPRHEPVRPR